MIRWTVGDGMLAFTAHDKWPYFDEQVALALLEPALFTDVHTEGIAPPGAATFIWRYWARRPFPT